MYLLSLDKSECCGCSACQQICGHKAIKMLSDKDGFIYPVKDESKCVNCGLCELVCPYNHIEDKRVSKEPSVFAAYARDLSIRQNSSSGALFYIIAEYVIKQGGIVYGASMNDDHKVCHCGVDNIDNLRFIRGSKYVQSSLEDCFIEIRSYLRSGRLVYFTGTGCQVAALKSFLIKDYDTLLTSDLICHGVPSQKLFDDHIAFLKKKYRGNIILYQFRDNENWGVCETVKIKKSSGKIKEFRKIPYGLSPYLYAFMNNMIFRTSCYTCPFAKIPRQGDLMLADFWGIKDYHPEIDSSAGVSLVLINTVKGKNIFDRISNELIYVSSDIKDAAKKNGNLLKPTFRPKIRDKIFKIIREKGYESVAMKEFRPANYHELSIIYKIIDFIGMENYKKIKSLFK